MVYLKLNTHKYSKYNNLLSKIANLELIKIISTFNWIYKSQLIFIKI